MFNLSGVEVLVILVLALIVLGPDKLPGAARKIGGVLRDLRRVSSGFQNEIQSALHEPERRPAPPVRATPPEQPDVPPPPSEGRSSDAA